MANRGRPKKSLDETLGLVSTEEAAPEETNGLNGKSVGIRQEGNKFFVDVFNYNIDGSTEIVVSLDCGNSFKSAVNVFKTTCVKHKVILRS